LFYLFFSEIRNRFIRTFSAVMTTVSKKLSTDEHFQAIADIAVEQPNLTKFLHEVQYVKQETYSFFIKMATDCTITIERYMTGWFGTLYFPPSPCKQGARLCKNHPLSLSGNVSCKCNSSITDEPFHSCISGRSRNFQMGGTTNYKKKLNSLF